MTTTGWIVAILSFAVALVLGFAACTLIRRRKEKNDQRKIEDAEQEALRIVNEAIKSSENKKREALLEAKEEILKSRSEYEKEEKSRRADLQRQERRLQSKEEQFDKRSASFEAKEEALEKRLKKTEAIQAGINAAIVGDLLTTLGSKVKEDMEKVKALGFETEGKSKNLKI